jgi:hypothetical protein
MSEIYLVKIVYIKTPEGIYGDYFIQIDARCCDDPYYGVVIFALRKFREITTDNILKIEVLSDNVKVSEVSSEIPYYVWK